MFIDIDTEASLYADDVRTRFMPVIYSSCDQLTDDQLHDVRVARVVQQQRPAATVYQNVNQRYEKGVGVWQEVYDVAEKTLPEIKAVKRAELNAAFNARKGMPVSVLGASWHGGFESALAIDGYIKVAEIKSLSTVTLTDANRVLHTLTLDDARTVAVAVSDTYGALYFAHDAAQAALESATSVADAINIAF